MQTDTKLPDPLVSATSPDRPNYALGVMLDARDFIDEQTYHRARLARALQFALGIGTVAGLEVTHVPEVPASPEVPDGRAEEIMVSAGLAIDGVGRLIEVPRAACITLQRWWNAQSNDALTSAFKSGEGGVVADVFVRFVACGRGRTPAFASGPFDALDATVYSRVRDGYELRLVPRPETPPAPLPQDPWASITGASPADRLASARTAILGMWKTLEQRKDRDVTPASLDRELDWVLLARVVIAAALDAGADRPRRLTTAPQIRNEVRSFVLTTAALARIVGP
jgi:hypothetical protein